MASTNPARGMRDFLPADVRKRNYVINIIKEVYESYGFEPLETPAVENIETLLGKYGEEGNQLVFKILKRGEKLDLENATKESDLSDLALRYDLTVPLARVVANNKNELPKFFKRYQIQPVWRADRPARGRFREFYQCDVDSIGSSSIVVEAEILSAVTEILNRLRFHAYYVQLNHRGLLSALLESAGIPADFHASTFVAIDKLDKIGGKAVAEEMIGQGLPLIPIRRLMDFMIAVLDVYTVSNSEKSDLAVILQKLANPPKNFDVMDAVVSFNRVADKNDQVIQMTKGFLAGNQNGLKSLYELESIIHLYRKTSVFHRLQLNPAIARGISYYTGPIMEVVLADGDFKGSIGGGGRYDGLIGSFGKEQIPACGFSLGLERILVVMEERGMFPPEIAESTPADVMVTIGSEETVADSLKLASELRTSGLGVTVYPQADKEDKQWKYANSIGVPWLCSVNEADIAEKMISFQDLRTRERFREPLENAAARMRGE